MKENSKNEDRGFGKEIKPDRVRERKEGVGRLKQTRQ